MIRRTITTGLIAMALSATLAPAAMAGPWPGHGGEFPEQPGTNIAKGCLANATNPRHQNLTPAPTEAEMALRAPATLRIGALFYDACVPGTP